MRGESSGCGERWKRQIKEFKWSSVDEPTEYWGNPMQEWEDFSMVLRLRIQIKVQWLLWRLGFWKDKEIHRKWRKVHGDLHGTYWNQNRKGKK